MKVRTLAGVAHDILRGARFYEQQEPGLGSEFRISVLGDILDLSKTGGIHRQTHGFYHALAAVLAVSSFTTELKTVKSW